MTYRFKDVALVTIASIVTCATGDEVAEWCQQYGLTEDTVRVLTAEGFTSLQYLSLLTAREVSDRSSDHQLVG